MLQSLREETEGKLQRLSLRKNGPTSLFKEVRVFKVLPQPNPKILGKEGKMLKKKQGGKTNHGNPAIINKERKDREKTRTVSTAAE